MKKEIFTNLVLTIALIAFASACSQTTTVNTNSAMNRNAASNVNSMANHNEMPMNSDMAGMSDIKSSPNAAAAPYDLQFLDTMSSHHQGAVDMAKTAIEKAQHPELKAFAQRIIVDQNKEIAQMKEWREKWFAGKPAAMNMEMPGMTDSMKMMAGDGMKKLEAATGNDFDVMFLEMMTPHHAGAIIMSKEALTRSEHTEIKTLANQIIKAQEAEIKMMADWKAKWAK
jgi:uncharacterized protein (DUF305 family)